jgi:zinc transport system substrate-binding protein
MILMFWMARSRSPGRLLTGVVAGAFALTGCGSGPGSSSAGEPVRVVAAFYPLQYVAERIAGDHADVTNLTRPGVEPHDLELNPRDVATLDQAALVVYLNGFQPAVDADPHFWLDPLRLADVADGVAARLAEVDRPHADSYRRNAAKLRDDLRALDQEFQSGLSSCRNRELVTSHTAFGYLARRYRFDQVGITGLSPEEEPSPAKMSEVARFVRTHDVGTIYYETLASPTLTRTLADETGAEVAVLDPVEGLTDKSAGTDYLAVMRANLRTLQKGQDC